MRDAGPLQPFIDAGAGVLDGGLATELEARGADLHDALWSAKVLLEQPERIVDVHLAYFEAGADVAIGASYQASEQGFASRGIDRTGTASLLRRSVELAREARDRWMASPAASARPRPLVAASVGPYGAVLADGSEYRGDYGLGLDELTDFHEARLKPLVEAGPDLLAIETIPAAREVEAVFAALERLGDPVPAWCSVTLRDGRHLADGSPLDEAAAIAEHSPAAVAFGVNCSPPDAATEAVAHLASTTSSLAVVAYPNRGADWDAEAKAWTGGGDVDMAAVGRGLLDVGAHLVGGCCGTGPDDVCAIAIEAAARPSRSRG